MDAVVLHSDIARLVLGYLKRQKLEGTSRLFCKTSPHLKHEFTVYRSGFTPHSFCPDLEDIICEYVNIKHIVDRFVSSLTSSQRFELFELKLPEKVKLLLERGFATNLKTQQSENSTLVKNIAKNQSTTSSSVNSDKENTANKRTKQKRKRESLPYSSDERQSPVILNSKNIKRRRILEPFCFISAKQQNLQRQRQNLQTPSTAGDQTQTDDEETHDEDSNEEENVPQDNETDLSLMEKPTKESTPHSKSANGKFSTPSVPELSQAILDNPQFQMKLVDNINQALNNSKCSETQPTVSDAKASTSNVSVDETNLSEEQQIITSNELLDQMVKDILKATEQDPAFDAIVENVVGATIQPTNVSAGVQCNIDTATAATQQQLINAPAVYDQQQFAFVQQHQQQLTLANSSTSTQQTTDSSTVPRTPIIIRTAISAANTSLNSGVGDAQVLSSLTANNSFGSLIDPNFSLSKLIVLNSNDSAQKQQSTGDQIIGNTTADNLISHLSNVGDATGDEQVFIDGSTGQFAIPLLLADEGLLANFPFFINNEGIIQQLQPENIGQLPPNTIIVTSAQKANPAEEKQIGGVLEPCTACKKPKETAIPNSLQSRSTVDSETPSGSGIVNTKAFKSLSTPRKRTSHVRTLCFSPKPTVSSRAAQKLNLRTNPIAEVNEELANSVDISERPIIKNVEILPSLGGPMDASANESSNSCSVPPLFVTEESSNQTVIKTELSLKEVSAVEKANKSKFPNKNIIKSAVTEHADTPKRKQIRKTAVRACKRQLSKSSDESETKSALTTQMEENEKSQQSAPPNTEQKVANLKDDKMLEEWLRLRNASNRDLDSRLRQINADQLAVIPKSARKDKRTPAKRRYIRRKRTTISKRMRKRVRQEAHKKAVLAESEADLSIAEGEPEEVVKPDVKIVEKTLHVKSAADSKRVSKERNKEFNIIIPTPQKEKRESLTKVKSVCVESANVQSHEAAASDAVDSAIHTAAVEQIAENETVHSPEQHLEKERDRRTANIACLLETPFKAPTLMDEIPPTPGKLTHPLDTPAAKLRAAEGDIHLSTSYLFGSLTKSELDTPQLSAITPGFRFTPFGSSRDVTPRSGTAPTDYSSGGSYYKPDESEDLDRNFEKLLRDSTQKQRQEEEERAQLLEKHLNAGEVKSALFEEQKQTVVEHTEQPEAEAICVEIPAEKLRVEPIVLKRVKSFGAEGADNTEATSNIDPHYTLVSELPEICAEGESSNSSSTISTTSSSSSQSSTSSSSSSSNSSGTTDHEQTAENESQKKSGNLSLSIDNLSSISSTEDEEWHKLAVTEEENSQLVSNDGEVRYPVRSWLTPSKVDPQAAVETHEHQSPATTIKVTVPLKSAEKRNRFEEDLQQKRERIMEKLKQDANQRRDKQPIATAAQPSGITAALSANRKVAAMREKAKILPAKATIPLAIATTKLEASKTKLVVEEKRTMEVLTALQLSAKKQVPQPTDSDKVRKPTTVPSMASLDDNATTTLFTQATTTTYELTEKTERLPLKTLISKVKAKQRQCVQIEALPSLKKSRTTSLGRKKIVRKPLGFKGTNAPETVFEPDQLEEVKTPHKVTTKSVVEQEDMAGKEVSPVPRIKIKTPTRLAADRPGLLRVSPRLLGNKKSKLKVGNEDDKEEASEDAIEATKTMKPLKVAKTKATNTAKKLLATAIKKSPVRTRVTKSKKTATKDVLEAKTTLDEQKQDEDKVRDEESSELSDKKEQEMLPVKHEKSDKSDNIQKLEKSKPEKKKDTEKKEKEAKPLGKMTKASKVSSESTKSDKEDMHAPAETNSEKSPSKALTATQKRKPKEKKETVAATEDKEDMTNQRSEAPSSSKIIDDASISKTNTKTKESTQNLQTQKDNITEGQAANIDKIDVMKQDQAIENDHSPKENEAEERTPNADSADANSESKTLPTSTTNMETEAAAISEADPMDACELTSVTEDDPVRFVSVTYNGADVAPVNPLPRRDFTNFKMVVAFDEEDKHIWRITDEMVLFTASPASQLIRNIPKKRKVRINTCGADLDSNATVGVVHSTTTTTAQVTTSTVSSSQQPNQRGNSSNEAKPAATSTPISAPATSSTQEPRRRTTRPTRNAVADTEIASGSTASAPSATMSSAAAGPTDVLQIDDIESLLSRLHGKEN